TPLPASSRFSRPSSPSWSPTVPPCCPRSRRSGSAAAGTRTISIAGAVTVRSGSWPDPICGQWTWLHPPDPAGTITNPRVLVDTRHFSGGELVLLDGCSTAGGGGGRLFGIIDKVRHEVTHLVGIDPDDAQPVGSVSVDRADRDRLEREVVGSQILDPFREPQWI